MGFKHLKIQLNRSQGSCMYHSSEVAMPVAIFLLGGGDKKSVRSARTKSKFHLFAFVSMTAPYWSLILNSLNLIEKYKKYILFLPNQTKLLIAKIPSITFDSFLFNIKLPEMAMLASKEFTATKNKSYVQ